MKTSSPGRVDFKHRNHGGITKTPIYFGLDGCRAGWFCCGIDKQGKFAFSVLENINEIEPYLNQARLILVDIPIGLPWQANPVRECDTAARKVLAPRGSSVFPAPARSALYKSSYREGCDENRRVLKRGLSVQSWNIGPKVKETDEFIRRVKPGNKIREMHPEVAFWALNQQQLLRHSKKTKEGLEERLAILSRHYPKASACFNEARGQYLKKEVASDDIVDAMVGAVTAMQHPRLSTLPENPPGDEEGIPMEIVYALNAC
jgi:predicted RNase H-like nuclease